MSFFSVAGRLLNLGCWSGLREFRTPHALPEYTSTGNAEATNLGRDWTVRGLCTLGTGNTAVSQAAYSCGDCSLSIFGCKQGFVSGCKANVDVNLATP